MPHRTLVAAEKNGRTILYRLKMSVLEDVLLGFAETFEWKIQVQGAGGRIKHERPRSALREKEA